MPNAPALIEDREVFSDQFGRRALNRTFRQSDGTTYTRPIVDIGPTVTVFALIEDPDDHDDVRVIVVNEFMEGINALRIGCIGARVRPGESAINAAKRRLFEETGYAPHPVAGGRIPEAMHLGAGPFMARHACSVVDIVLLRNCTKVAEPEPKDTSVLEMLTYDFDAWFKMVFIDRSITDVHAVAATGWVYGYLQEIQLTR